MKPDYSAFLYFKGENENPFDWETQNTAHNFWDYESMFEEKFNNGNFSQEAWIPSNHFDKNEWISVLNQEPIDKEELFKLWLFFLLMVHLPDKYETSDTTKFLNLYWKITTDFTAGYGF